MKDKLKFPGIRYSWGYPMGEVRIKTVERHRRGEKSIGKCSFELEKLLEAAINGKLWVKRDI